MNKDIIYVRIDEEIKKKLDYLALEDNRSLNNLVVKILTEYANKNYTEEEKKNS